MSNNMPFVLVKKRSKISVDIAIRIIRRKKM